MKVSVLFYEKITRRQSYIKKDDGSYKKYREYYEEILEDCNSKCVYCDVSLNECGFENMNLDHFRPWSKPEFNHLKDDPNNLVLSCPKCNSYKSDKWPIACDLVNTHNGKIGFADPFVESYSEYFSVDKETGVLNPKNEIAKYMIKSIKLNRLSRVKLRAIRMRKDQLSKLLNEALNNDEKLPDETKKLLKAFQIFLNI